MKRLLFFFTVLLFSSGWINAQEQAVMELTLEPSGNSDVNTRVTIPTLDPTAEWTVTATTFYKGVESGTWGSRLFSIQNMENFVAGSGFPGYEFYIRPQETTVGNAGIIGVNNSYGKLNTEPFVIDAENGTPFIFVISSDGSGTITATVTVGDQTFPSLTKESALAMDFVEAAQNYPVDVTIEYYPLYLDVAPEAIDFGAVLQETEVGPTFVSIAGSDAFNDPISYELTKVSGDPDAIYIDPNSESSFSSETGGQLGFYFNPYEPGDCEALLTITRGEETKTVTIKGKAMSKVPVIISPAIGNPNADSEGNVWYRIQSNKRTGYVFTDMGEDMPLEATSPDKDNADQLWKFIATSTDGQFKLVSKNGRELGYRSPVIEEAVQIEPGMFITVASSNATYSFQLRSDVNYQLIWNEYEPAPENENPNNAAYVNKMGGTDTRYTAYYYSQTGLDDGNSTKFYLHSEELLPAYPEFSTDTKDVWYFIQFNRRAAANLVWEEIEEVDSITHANVIQAVRKETEPEAQYWKLVGDKDNFKIISYNTNSSLGLSLPETGGSRMQAIDYNDGDLFAFSDWSYNASTGTFQLQIINTITEGESTNYFYVNDFQGKAVCQYLANDAGNYVTFIPVDDGMAMEEVDMDDKMNDAISKVYYTIQGIQLGNVRPTAPGFYIEKSIGKSGNVSAQTIYVLP